MREVYRFDIDLKKRKKKVTALTDSTEFLRSF